MALFPQGFLYGGHSRSPIVIRFSDLGPGASLNAPYDIYETDIPQLNECFCYCHDINVTTRVELMDDPM